MTNLSEKQTRFYENVFLIENNWKNVFYVHTPFCLQKCYYCIYSSKVPSSKEEMDTFYNKILPVQLEQYRKILENITFHQIYFGGGTPTIVDADKLEQVFKRIPGFDKIALKTTEASPYTITDEHVDLFHEYRFIYVSLGVQSLSQQVLEKQNRLTVSKDKLIHICRYLDKYDMISNMDLIFFLDTGGMKDLELARKDLDEMMSIIRPVSITLHSNYRFPKSLEKSEAMISLISEMLDQYPEYQCVNSLLQKEDAHYDMINSAEYRLMRKKKDFNFYMLPKIPLSHAYGHNMLSAGELGDFKPRYNYYYIFDFMDKYLFKDFYCKLKAITLDFEQIREKLNLAHHNFSGNNSFFIHETGKKKFKEILKQTRYPFYEI
jgi:coproporphyrinogen III oxidase-like Fe-S oxidoreductase